MSEQQKHQFKENEIPVGKKNISVYIGVIDRKFGRENLKEIKLVARGGEYIGKILNIASILSEGGNITIPDKQVIIKFTEEKNKRDILTLFPSVELTLKKGD